MSKPAGLVARVIALGESSTDPAHESAPLSIDQWTEHQVEAIGHSTVAAELNLVEL
ncbi:MAG TPA: hypothetical protein PKD54_14510 [Pirellulaceae bacterium]|nr:hypothetical protein [Pirellulaceae bacterium]